VKTDLNTLDVRDTIDRARALGPLFHDLQRDWEELLRSLIEKYTTTPVQQLLTIALIEEMTRQAESMRAAQAGLAKSLEI
jgi:hypothetical protein